MPELFGPEGQEMFTRVAGRAAARAADERILRNANILFGTPERPITREELLEFFESLDEYERFPILQIIAVEMD